MIIEAPAIARVEISSAQKIYTARARLATCPRNDFAERASISVISAESVGRLIELSSRARRNRRRWSVTRASRSRKAGCAASMATGYYHAVRLDKLKIERSATSKAKLN